MTQKRVIRVHNQSLRRLYFPGQCFSPLQLFSNSSCPALGRAADLFTTRYQSRHFQVFKQQDVTQKLPHHEEMAYRVEPNSTSAAKGWWAQAQGTGWAWGTASFSSSTSQALSLTYSPNSLRSMSDVQSPSCNLHKARSCPWVLRCKSRRIWLSALLPLPYSRFCEVPG